MKLLEFFTYKGTGNTDKLVKVESLAGTKVYNIDYSANGEPNLYFGWTVSYDMKNITTLLNDEYEINYTYNTSGIRTSKVITKNDNTTSVNYFLDGTNIIKEVRSGQTNATLQYFYDSNNEIIGFTYNNIKCLYLKNLQNDVIGIVDNNNNVMVKYYYNAYGQIVNVVDTSGINLSTINPFRYRSYYQDDETGWYYLNSRYYDSKCHRFITMDDIDYLGDSESVLSYNLYSYCENNPIVHIDSEGNAAANIIGGIVGGVIGALLGYIIAEALNLKGWKKALLIGAVTVAGAVLGAVIGPYVAKASRKVISVINSGIRKASNAASKAISNIKKFSISNKHLAGAKGNYAKFTTSSKGEINNLITKALKSPNATFYPNGNNSYYILTNMGKVIGSKGETVLKVVFDIAGKIWTAFPDK